MINRIRTIQNQLEVQAIDALLVTNQHNVTYLTGFSGLSPGERENFCIITPTSFYMLTFPTYYGLFTDIKTPWKILNITDTQRFSVHVKHIITRHNINSFGYEADDLTIDEFDRIRKAQSVTWKRTSGLIQNIRIKKNSEEIKKITHAAAITDETFAYILTQIHSNHSERTLALMIEHFIKSLGHNIAFPPIVAFDAHAAIPHHLPSNSTSDDTRLILFDFGAKVESYCADMTRMVFLGTPTDTHTRAYEALLAAQSDALSSIHPGADTAAIDIQTREQLVRAGYPVYPHGLGHGVGIQIHEQPKLKHSIPATLEPGMVVTVEPGIYIDGSYGMRIEDLVVLGKHSATVLSKTTKDMIVL